MNDPSASLAGERTRTLLAASTFFLVLCSYYVLRPVRDTMAVHTGPDGVPWLFTATFFATLAVTPVFGWFVQRCPRRWLAPLVYSVMLACLASFHLTFLAGVTASAAIVFFVWVSLFNLMVVSLFWSSVSDAFTTEQAQRRYGYITAGGTAGAIAGPALTALLAEHVSVANLLLISMGMLTLAGGGLWLLARQASGSNAASDRPLGGSIFAGITHTLQSPLLTGIVGLMMCYSAVSAVLYQEVTDIVGKTYADPGQRTAYFARVDLGVNILALALQLLVTQRLLQFWGLRWALSTAPAVLLGGLAVVGSVPTAALYALVQVLHRACEFALSKPAREVLFTTVDAENRYKAKNFIDTAVYRANDTASIWVTTGIRSLGGNPVWLLAVPATMAWLALCQVVARRVGQQSHPAPPMS